MYISAGPHCSGPIGMVVAGALKGDIRESLNKFKIGVRPGGLTPAPQNGGGS